ELMPGWMRTLASVNPLDWAVVAGRSALAADPDWGLVAVRGGGLVGLAVLAAALATRTLRAYQRAARFLPARSTETLTGRACGDPCRWVGPGGQPCRHAGLPGRARPGHGRSRRGAGAAPPGGPRRLRSDGRPDRRRVWDRQDPADRR